MARTTRNAAREAPAAAQAPQDRHPLIGKRVKIRCETEVLSHYEAGPTAPERVMVKVGGITTVVPMTYVEVVQ